jgi:hypothetical protein
MFDTGPPHGAHRQVDPGVITGLAERARPVAASHTRLLPVTDSLAELLPEKGLRRGSSVMVNADEAGGATTLALGLLRAASAAGSWCVGVGLPDLGGLSLSESNLDLDRVAFVPWPGPHFAETVALLIEGIDIVVLCPPQRVRAQAVRRLMARVRDRRAVLIVLASGATWPEGCDVELRVEAARWVAAGRGGDCLRQRRGTVTAVGRRSANRPVQRQLWLPGESLAVESA